ncbi:co-chaperone HscB [Amycolatopsis sp. K13G38]|uniref:Co-chaperone HscB n=1 Tax=Amycolatopsis acididurans TaxID=2724524 RepID=A0ABX1IW06_9PSEU|nr:co-chaperone HscB [Amycolatopsis acididurans]NKQ51664.1 co-chaperone HscB [Amycolatopsis acididurans]
MNAEVVAFLVRAAREFRDAGWVFTGFHWPVLAGEVAARLDASGFRQLFEAGFATAGPADELPTSTTDFAAFGSAVRWRGSTGEVLGGLVRRAGLVVLDAANVDLAGRVNSTAIGGYHAPTVRLPGGGGAADAAGAARDLLLLHGGADPARLVRAVEHVTAAPAPDARVRLLTRWGTMRLGARPCLLTAVGDGGPLAGRLRELGVETGSAGQEKPPSDEEKTMAARVLEEAAVRGYVVAREALGV